MQRFWFTGACEPRKRRRTSSKPLALAQFMSAFLLLGIGICMSVLLLVFEHGYFAYLRPYLMSRSRGDEDRKKAGGKLCSLVSLSVAESLKTADPPTDLARPKVTFPDESPDDEDEGDQEVVGRSHEDDEEEEMSSSCEDSIAEAEQELVEAKRRIRTLELQLASATGNHQHQQPLAVPKAGGDEMNTNQSGPRRRRNHASASASVHQRQNGETDDEDEDESYSVNEFETAL